MVDGSYLVIRLITMRKPDHRNRKMYSIAMQSQHLGRDCHHDTGWKEPATTILRVPTYDVFIQTPKARLSLVNTANDVRAGRPHIDSSIRIRQYETQTLAEDLDSLTRTDINWSTRCQEAP